MGPVAQDSATQTRRAYSGWGRLAASQDRLASFVDQGLQGVANIGVSALLARALTKVEFASIGLMLGIYFFLLGIHRAHVVLPFVLDGHIKRDAVEPSVHDRWWAFNLVFVGGVGAALMVVSGITAWISFERPDLYWINQAFIFSVAVAPFLLMVEFARRWLYQAGLPKIAAAASGVYFVLNLGVAALVYLKHAGAEMGIICWVAAAAGFVGVTVLAAPPRWVSLRDGLSVWRRHRQFSIWQMITHLPYALYNNSVVLLISAFGGPLAAASFTVARTLNSPVTSVVAAVDLLDKPRAVRALASGGIKGLRRSVARTRLLLVTVNGAYVALLVVFAPVVLKLAFGEAFEQYTPQVRLLAASFFLLCLNQPSETLLIILKANRTMFFIRLSMGIAVVVAMAVASRFYGAAGCVAALTIVQVLNLIELWVAERWAAGRWIGPKEDQGNEANEASLAFEG